MVCSRCVRVKMATRRKKDAVFELFNPEFSRYSTENEDIRYSKRVRINTKEFDIPLQFIQNWRECNRIVGTKLALSYREDPIMLRIYCMGNK